MIEKKYRDAISLILKNLDNLQKCDEDCLLLANYYAEVTDLQKNIEKLCQLLILVNLDRLKYESQVLKGHAWKYFDSIRSKKDWNLKNQKDIRLALRCFIRRTIGHIEDILKEYSLGGKDD